MNSPSFTTGLAVTWAVATLLLAGLLTVRQIAFAWAVGRTARAPLALLGLAGALLMLRPHQDTLVGLDLACYRNMARAFLAGRPLHGPDRALGELPPELRRAVLMKYEGGRPTRDRTFEILDLLGEPRTRPWFQPALPLLSCGLARIGGERLLDFGVPLLGVLVWLTALAQAVRLHPLWGPAALAPLWWGTPLLVWTLRGHFPEMAGLALAMIGWGLLADAAGHPVAHRLIAAATLGWSAAFHPIALTISAPLLLTAIAMERGGRRVRIGLAAAFAAGLMPLTLQTGWVAQPYGDFTSLSFWTWRLRVDVIVRAATLVALAGAAGAALLSFAPDPWLDRARGRMRAALTHRRLYLAVLACAALPTVALVIGPLRQPWVVQGLREIREAYRIPLLALLAVGAAASAMPVTRGRDRWLLVLTVALIPLFAYLKGFDQMGLWSQRRLAPWAMLAAWALTPALARIGAWVETRAGQSPAARGFARVSWAVVLLVALLANPLRWPGPWWVRSEHRVDAFLRVARDRLRDALAVFDYEAFSSPLAVLSGTRIFGINQDGFRDWPALLEWLKQRARSEPVRIVSAWANPRLENGAMLVEDEVLEIDLPIVRSRQALPAESAVRPIRWHVLRLVPLGEGPAPELDKLCDGGRLALRGPWDRVRPVSLPDGRTGSTQWTRNGSGLVGPCPLPGGRVLVELWATSGRPGIVQTMRLTPPWGGEPVLLEFGDRVESRTVVLTRPPAEAGTLSTVTGIYILSSPTPYDPAAEGLRGYASDLGVLLHRVRIRVLGGPSASTTPDADATMSSTE